MVVVAAGLGLVCVLAFLVDVPVAAWALAGLLLIIAFLRLLPAAAPVIGARSVAFDVALLVILAGALAVLAPAGLLD